jgi:hypothetical protein
VEDAERKAARQRLETKFGGKNIVDMMTIVGRQEAMNNFYENKGLGKILSFGLTDLFNMAQGKQAPAQSSFQKVYDIYVGNDYEKFKQSQEKVYRETFSALYPQNETFVLTPKSRPTMQAGITTWFVDRPDYADIKTKFDDPNSQVVVTTTPSITGFGGTKLSMRIVGDKGETTAPIEISLQQYQSMFNKNPDAVNPAMTLMRGIIQGSPDNSSNSNGLGSVPTSFFKRGSFPYLTPQYNILGGDFIQSSDGSDLFFPKLYYVPKGINDTVTLDVGKGMSLVDVLGFPTMVDDNKVGQIIRNQ